MKGDKILLEKNHRVIIRNKINPSLDSLIINTKNSIGLRGDEPIKDLNDRISIITVGGSTTECRFLSDDKTWPFLLGEQLKKSFDKIWMNNAGLDGHSTFGHQVMVNDHLLDIRPRLMLFLTGINDVENDGPTFHDRLNTKGAFPDLVHYIYNESEVVNLVVNLFRGVNAQHYNNTTQHLQLPGFMGKKIMTAGEIQDRKSVQKKYVAAYALRLQSLIDTCKQNKIVPVFITQPALYGYGVDPVTGVDLSTAAVAEDMNGKLLWEVLQLYNDTLNGVCRKNSVHCIDLAAQMPKSSRYYYDQTHFTNEGAAMAATLLASSLENILNENFPGYSKRSN